MTGSTWHRFQDADVPDEGRVCCGARGMGYDYDPITGVPPGDFADAVPAFAVQERDDGTWVELPDLPDHVRTVGDVVVETLVAWGVTQIFGMVGHSNLGVAEAMRRAQERGELRYIGIRHEGAASFVASGYAKLSGRPAACLAIAGGGSTNLLTSGPYLLHVVQDGELV